MTLRHHQGAFYGYDPQANVYTEIDEPFVRSQLYEFLEKAHASHRSNRSIEPSLGPFKPTKSKVENVIDAVRAVSNLRATQTPPCWLSSRGQPDPFEILACRNGLLHVPTRRLLPPSPHFFTLNGLDIQFCDRAPLPEQWFRFLSQLWPADSESISVLQEWMGYLLTPRTHFQKILMLIGPKRSGKGTIARVIRMLLGDRNVCGPTLANMAEQFGLSILIGKSAAIIGDARVGGRTDTSIITERLLSISGEDPLSIPRKYLPDWNGKLSTRFMLITNELPRIEDGSGALSSRFIILSLTESFYGREDHGLLEKLTPELPGILLWALDGWARLYERGRFIEPRNNAELAQEFEDLASPVSAFLRDCCQQGENRSVSVEELYRAWRNWCLENGRDHPGNAQAFGRNLRAAISGIKIRQPRIDGDRIRYYEGISLKGR
jgi:putative DNA primase/helicase